MAYVHKYSAEEIKEAGRKAARVMEICEQLHITTDPIDWQTLGIQANVTVNKIAISDLRDLSRQDSESILRLIQIKLLERAARDAIHAHPDVRALIWNPVDVIQPQPFLNLWIMTMETDERVAIAEYLRNGQRTYEHYWLDVHNREQLTTLFGPLHTGDYHIGDSITVEERDRKYSGEIVYILLPGKVPTSRRYSSRGTYSTSGKAYTNEVFSRYLVDCHDGFPHILNQSQIIDK